VTGNIRFILNNEEICTREPVGMVLLDFIREHKRLLGTKIGCRQGECGACTVLVGSLEHNRLTYRAMTSCLMPLGNAMGKHIVTIEGLNRGTLTPVQQAIADGGASQCGFCTAGIVVALTGFCLNGNRTGDDSAIAAIDGNICRCTGYKSLERAAAVIENAVAHIDERGHIAWLVQRGFVPEYFTGIQKRLKAMLEKIRTEEARAGSTTHYVGGGTDLYVQRPEEMEHEPMECLFDSPGLKGIGHENGRCSIGGATTAEEMRQSSLINEIFPDISAFMKRVASTPIRNMATVAGNLINASPVGDLTIIFLALDSEILLNNRGNRRAMLLKNFYRGYKDLNKEPDEILEAVVFDIPQTKALTSFEKVSKRTHLDIASVNSAVCLAMEHNVISKAGVSSGGVAPVPLYLEETSSYLKGKEITKETVRKAAQTALGEISPISDIRGSATYKRLLLRQQIYAHFAKLFPTEFEVEDLV
jgi:xanthine dehydrogenase small subunit